MTALIQAGPNYCTCLNVLKFLFQFLFSLSVYLFLPDWQVIIYNIFLLLECLFLVFCGLHGKQNTWSKVGAYGRQNNVKKMAPP